MRLAGWWPRVGAFLLDALAQWLLVAVVFGLLVACDSVGGAVDIVGTVVFGPGLLVVWFGYAPFLCRRPGPRNGQTLGKQLLGIRATRDDGQPYGVGSALVRELVVKEVLFGLVGTLALSIPFILDSLWPLWGDSNQALHDKLVRSHVVRA